MKKYNAYKDSGVEWIGEIPEHWQIIQLKFVCNIQGRVGYKGYTVGDLVGVGEGPYTLGAKHISKKNKLDLSSPEFISWAKYHESPEIMVYKGDLLLTQRGTLGKVVIIEEDIGETTINPSMVLLNQLNCLGKFLYYFFNSAYFSKWVDLNNTATAVPMLSQEQLGNFKILLSSENEQSQIAQYLDHKTTQIDKLITDKENLIELLNEERTAVINQAVSKGLNPNAPMKDSGIEWLGEIPQGWKVSKLKYHTNKIIDGAHFTPTYIDDTNGVPFLRVTDIHNKTISLDEVKRIPLSEHLELIKRCKPEIGDVLLSKNGTIGLMKIVDWDWGFSIFVSLCLLKFKTDLINKFFIYFFDSNIAQQQIFESSQKTSVTNLHLEKIKELIIPIPSLSEQQLIVEFLDNEIDRINIIITKVNNEIELLKEYKTALISEVVTGKVDVRNKVPAELTILAS